MRVFQAIGLLLIALHPVAALADDEPIRLEASTGWVLDYAEDSCALRRLFGQPDQTVYVEFRKFAPGDAFQLIVTSRDFRTHRNRFVYRFLPDSESEESSTLPLVNSEHGEGHVVVQMNLMDGQDRERNRDTLEETGHALVWTDAERDSRESEVSSLLIERGFSKELQLITGNMHAPMGAMRRCTDELLSHWGIDAEAHRNLARPARPKDLSRWARALQERYPSSMVRSGGQAIVRPRVMIGADGVPTDCVIQHSMHNATFNEVACELLVRHGEFEPALDKDQQPISSYWTVSVVYHLN